MNNKTGALTAEQLAIKYSAESMTVGENQLLQKFKLEIPAGAKVLLTGANGTGKSSLLKRLAAEIFEPESELLYFGESAVGMKTQRLAQIRHQVFQVDVPYPNFSVNDYLALSGLSADDKHLEEFGLLDIQHRSIQKLSGGEWMRTRLALLWLQPAPVALLDEIENSLDAEFRKKIFQMILDSSRTIVAITHSPEIKSLAWTQHLEIANGQIHHR